MVKFASEVVAKQRGPVKRCANHKCEDMQAGTFMINVLTTLRCMINVLTTLRQVCV